MAALVWGGAVAGRWWGWAGVIVVALASAATAVLPPWRPMLGIALVLAVAGWWSGHSAALREQAILDFVTAEGPVDLPVRLLVDPRQGDYGWWALAVADPAGARPDSIPMLLSFEDEPPGQAGQHLEVVGRMAGRTGRARGDPYSGVLFVTQIRLVDDKQAPWWEAGNGIRKTALERLHGRGAEHALLAGFLVGDTSEVPDADLEAMRRTGLSHLVAVSGSNVSLFLMLTLLAAGPLAAGPRRRAVIGLIALAVLVVATRWEPSVVRACAMAGLVLAGRVGGWALDTVTSLGVTVIGVVVLFGEMATDVGFTLSVLATLGVLVGGMLSSPSMPRFLGSALAATLGAQVAVAPVLLTVFGSMPLMAPVTNLVAVPIVAVSTAFGAVGVALGFEMLIGVAAAGAGMVLSVARMGASWPQIGWEAVPIALAVALFLAVSRLRPFAALVGAALVGFTLMSGPSRLPPPAAVIFDVGQGDAILVVSNDHRTMLVDGGPDPAILEQKLSAYGITRLDLVVLTHVHADHATGLEAVIGRRPVGEIWLPSPPHSTPASRRVRLLTNETGIPSRHAPVGHTVTLGDLVVEVLAPVRRYASPNDQSVVLLIHAPGGPRLLLTGDIETYAQADLAGLKADILKVPHQGAATSDTAWLAAVGADEAIISVGPNDFGHPSDGVIAALRSAGSKVTRTDVEGDVVVPLAPR
ncbi:MAG TPA: ComEC/Rec2 family competence protein [Acidimicrobiia bacterium]|nr:ComEC/Rec2 family competence protein [Acidimicrobiia bacterium]